MARETIGLTRSDVFLASVTYSDLGSLYFRVVKPAQVLEIYRYISKNSEIREAAVLWTCNRFEIYFYPGTHANVQYIKGYLEGKVSGYRITHGMQAVRHLFYVASGLESMLPGENEILGQVREAWKLSEKYGMSGSIINNLFRTSIEAGKLVRSQTSIGKLRRSIAREAVDMFEEAGGRDPVLVVGAGNMGRQLVTILKERGHLVSLTNRTAEKGRKLADAFHIPSVRFEKGDWKNYASCFIAVRAENYIIEPDDLPEGSCKVIVDVSTPFAVNPEIESSAVLINLEKISERLRKTEAERRQMMEQASVILEAELRNYIRSQEDTSRSALIRRLFEISDRIVEEEMRHLKKQSSVDVRVEQNIRFAMEKERDRILSVLISSLKGGDIPWSNEDIEKFRKNLDSIHEKTVDIEKLR